MQDTVQDTTVFDERLEEVSEIADPEVDILAEGGLHKIMLFFHLPAAWSDGALLLLWLAFAGLAGLLWGLLSGDINSIRAVTLFSGVMLAADMLLLRSLPRRGISYGPWQAQFVVLALPQLAATAVIALFARWFGIQWGIGLLAGIQLIGLAALIWGTEIEPFRLRLTEFIMFTDRMKPGSPPLRLLHITDLHIERLTAREEQVVELAQKAKPDLIVITGDFVNLSYNRDPETHRQVWQLLRRLKAPHGVYATLGSPTVDLRETVAPIFDELPVQLLRQECVLADVGHGRTLSLIGLDCTHHIPTDEARLAQLMAQAPNNSPQLLL
ncbi:MAG TPA: metallophosphoesterase, partial [Chloroflexota bacterium]|nr:metallophosphoesterase [Chloroflexota bacterium]